MGAHTILPDIPDDVLKQMFQFLPTKAAICVSCLSKQWQGVPISDFDEGGEHDDYNFDEHRKFINMLKFQLVLCEKEKQRQTTWDKFRLRMTRYSARDATIVYKWLKFSFERSVKELDLSLRGSRVQNYYYLCRTSFINAKSLTILNLESVRIKIIMDIDKGEEYYEQRPESLLLPSLKTMSLKDVQFDSDALISLVWDCPLLEYLTLTSCRFDWDDIVIASKSLKSLELKHCETYQVLLYADNLEHLTVFSSTSSLDNMYLERCFNLKYMNICDPHLYHLSVQGCHDVNGTIDAPRLHGFIFRGHLKSNFSFRAPNLRAAYIILLDKWGGDLSTFNNGELIYFLQAFGSSTGMTLYVYDFSDLIFSEEFRKSCSSPILPNLQNLKLLMRNPPTNFGDDEDLMESLHWMAPSLQDITTRHFINSQTVGS
ncbi:putative F-box/FBD/LRR-repeat protein [Rosa sericea]